MSLTFRDYLIVEAAGMDPREIEAAPQDNIVDLTSEIRKIMQAMDALSPTETGEGHEFTFVDLLEALTTLEEVIMSRLSSDGAMVDDLRGGEKHVAAQGREWEGDEQKGFERLFNSIGTEAKDAIRNIFAGIPDENAFGGSVGQTEKVQSPRFVQAFNSLIVNRVIGAMKDMGIEQSVETVPGIIHAAKQAVVNNERNLGNLSSKDLNQLVRKYHIARTQTVGRKRASGRTRHDRAKLSQAMGD